MKVLNKKSITKQTECECSAILEYTTEDIETGSFGHAYISCPECDARIYLDDEDGKELTTDNISFPQDFTEFGEGIDVDDKTINKWIKQCLSSLTESDEDSGVTAECGSGNTMVFAKKYSDEYTIWVTRNYCESAILRK